MFCNMAWWVKMPAYITRVKTLTAKEWLILQLLSSGERNVDIATQLNRSEKTISQHIKNIERKLQVENRIHLSKMLMNAQNLVGDFQGNIDLDFIPKQLAMRI
ncbi:hypothetical protein GJV10_18625 [Ewingella americana]|nr:hypothetical protein [Ewingella americana]